MLLDVHGFTNSLATVFGRPGLLSHFTDESTGSDKKGDQLQKNVTSVRVRAKAPRPAAQAFKKCYLLLHVCMTCVVSINIGARHGALWR